jgi:RHS repeat-associated protein
MSMRIERLGSSRAGAIVLRAWIVLGLSLVGAALGPRVPAASAMEGPGGGESNPFAALQGDASTQLFTGAASVTIPIRLPPGRKNATPDLALRYSSHGGLSFVGLGWSLPLGVLSRSIEKGTPSCLGSDPESFRLTLSASSNELVRESEDRFLLELDEGWAEAIPDRAANQWIVRTREGMTYTFGASESSRVYGGGDRFHDPSTCAFTTAWHVTRLEDPNGNTIELAYEKAGNAPLPSGILYGGNPDAGIPHPFRIRFESEDLVALGRPILRTLASGVDQALVRRLARVLVEMRTTATGVFEEIHRYAFAYDDSLDTADFLLAAVEATELPRRTFHYSTPHPTVVDDLSEPVQDPHTLGTSRDFGSTLALMELNGDGLLDRLCVNGSGDWHAAYGEAGQVQFSGYSACSTSGNWHVPTVPGVRLDRISKMVDGRDVYLTLDLDGDGLQDLVHRPSQSASIHVYRGRCASAWDCGFSDQYAVWNNPYPASDRSLRKTSTGNRGQQTLRDLVDLNGDGRPDLVRALPNGDWEVRRNHGSGFEDVPVVLPAIDELIAYSPFSGQNADVERQLIDVNDDGLVDWVQGVVHREPLERTQRLPELYFGVGPQGQVTGPFAFGSNVYLCPPTPTSLRADLCTGANALPPGFAIVGAATVRLNTGSGFSAPIHTPAPFWDDADETANRLRAAYSTTSRETRTYRDFVDVNGDGRVDWVSTAHPWEGGDDWYVLYNQGDGRFGGGLEVLAPAAPSIDGAYLGRVRPAKVLEDVANLLGRSFQHVQPDDRSDRQMMALDIDGDGLPEHVKAFGLGGGDRWELRRLRFEDEDGLPTRPLLLVRIEDGVGGTTHYRHAPSTRFVPPPEQAPRLPFVLWLVTGIRRTDGLCDVAPTDWFSLAGNPCLAAGHELVERFEYEDGVYDGLARELRGFGRTRVFEGPAETGSLREIVFHQSAALRGKIASESLFAGGVDRLSQTTYDWRVRTAGVRMQVYLQEQRVEEHALYADFGGAASQCVVHRNSIFLPGGEADPQTRIQSTCSMACAGAGDSEALCDPTPPGKKQIDTTWAEPIAGATRPVWDRPAEIVTRHVDASGTLRTTARVRHVYDGLGLGFVDRGNLTAELARIAEDAEQWAIKLFGYDAGEPVGPGNVTSVHVPVSGQARVPTRIDFDDEFALHPVREIASVSDAGASAERRIESRYDLRHGKRTESVGLHGRGAGDVAGTLFDGLGRPVCEYAPGTTCGNGSGFVASVEYRHVYGDPTATDPLARLSRVEIRRREPNAPEGFVTTRAYWDALGRERLTTQEQNVVDPPLAAAHAALETVVLHHVEYGPNGKPARAFAPYVAPASGPDLAAPGGTAAIETSYVLNGNAAGRLDPAGRIFETTGFDGSRTRSYFLGRTLRRVDGVVSAATSGNHTVETLDEHGRVVERRSLHGSSLTLAQWNAEYDGRDAIVAEWFGGSQATRIDRAYDLLGRAVETDDPDAGRWSVRYDEAGNEIFRDDPKPGQGVQSCYDGMNRIVLQCVRTSDAPDPALCAAPQPDCVSAYRYRYDEATPLLSTPNRGLGRLTTVEGPDSRHRYVYDVRGRVVLQVDDIQGVSGVTRYAYRPDLDRLEQMTYPDGEIVRHGYDASGQPAWLSQVDAAGNWLAYYVREILYDLRGRPVSIEHGNLTTDRFEYHGPSESFALARISSRSRSATVLDPRVVYSDLQYRDYDANGRLVRVDDARDPAGALSMTAQYAYDAVGRLTSVAGARPETFAYDAIGNLRAIDGQPFAQSPESAVTLGPHQLDRIGPASSIHWTLAFDENGRRTAKRRSDGSVDERYVYDAFGALRVLTVQGALTVFGYDHEGRRVVESRAGSVRRFFGRHAELVDGVLVKSYFVGDRLVAMRTADVAAMAAPAGEGIARGAVSPPVRSAVIALGALLLVVPLGGSRRALGLRIARSGALGSGLLVVALSLPVVVPLAGCAEQAGIRHFHLNHLGSPVAITGAGGGLERQYRYSAYGKVRRFDGAGRPSAADATNRREFTGHATDPTSGLQYAGSRYYDPELASFLTPDPADEHASPYAYVGWDPVNAVDPNGAELSVVAAILFALSAALVVAGAIVAGIQSGSVSVGFQTLGIGVAGLAAGYVVGLAAPAAASAAWISQTSAAAINTTLSVAGVGVSVYGLATSSDLSGTVLAGAGLALSLAGAAWSIGSLARPSRAGPPSVRAGPSSAGDDAPLASGGSVVRTSVSPSVAQRIALEAQRRMLQIAQFTALAKVRTRIAEIRAQYAGRPGLDVYAEVLIEGPRIPHPTRVFGQHLLPNRVEVTPNVVPVGRGPTPALLAPVPWDRFRIHEFIAVVRDGVPVSPD